MYLSGGERRCQSIVGGACIRRGSIVSGASNCASIRVEHRLLRQLWLQMSCPVTKELYIRGCLGFTEVVSPIPKADKAT